MGGQVTFYMKNKKKWKEFIEVAEREGKKASKLLQDFIESYVSLHAPGNPQTMMSSFGEGGKITISTIEGRVRQLCLELRGELKYLRIVNVIKEQGISDGSMRVAMAERVVSWLKERGLKVYR